MADPTVVTTRYGTIITAIGKAKITAAILAGKKVNITTAAVGDGGGAYYKPTEDQTDLINTCWIGEIASYAISESNPNMIEVKFFIPAEVGGITIREARISDDEGDVIAIWNTPDVQKPEISEGAALPLKMLGHIIVEDAKAVSITVNPALDTVTREEMETALKAHAAAVGSAINADIVIPKDGWFVHELTDPEFVNHPYACDVAVKNCTEKHFPVFTLSMAYYLAAAEAGLSQQADTLDGIVRFYAKKPPEVDMVGTLQLRSDSLLEDVLGMLATNKEVNDEVVEGVFGENAESGGTTEEENPTEDDVPAGYTVSADEEVFKEINQGVFGQ